MRSSEDANRSVGRQLRSRQRLLQHASAAGPSAVIARHDDSQTPDRDWTQRAMVRQLTMSDQSLPTAPLTLLHPNWLSRGRETAAVTEELRIWCVVTNMAGISGMLWCFLVVVEIVSLMLQSSTIPTPLANCMLTSHEQISQLSSSLLSTLGNPRPPKTHNTCNLSISFS